MVSLATTEPCPCCGKGSGRNRAVAHSDKSSRHPPPRSSPLSVLRSLSFRRPTGYPPANAITELQGTSPTTTGTPAVSGSVLVPVMVHVSSSLPAACGKSSTVVSPSSKHLDVDAAGTSFATPAVLLVSSVPSAAYSKASSAASPSEHLLMAAKSGSAWHTPSITCLQVITEISPPPCVFSTHSLAAALPRESLRRLSGGGLKALAGGSWASATSTPMSLGIQNDKAVVCEQMTTSCKKECCRQVEEDEDEEADEWAEDEEEKPQQGKQEPLVIRIAITCTCGREQNFEIHGGPTSEWCSV